jgi:hypothetical protein
MFLGELHIAYMDREPCPFSCCECDVNRLGYVTFKTPFLIQFWFASSVACSLSEAMAGSLSVSSTAVSSTKNALIDSGEVGSSVVYRKYNNDHMKMFWGTPALPGESSVYSC